MQAVPATVAASAPSGSVPPLDSSPNSSPSVYPPLGNSPANNNVAGTTPMIINSTSVRRTYGPNPSASLPPSSTPKPALDQPPTSYYHAATPVSPSPNLAPLANNNTALTTSATASKSDQWFNSSKLGEGLIGIVSHVSTKHKIPLKLESYTDTKFGGLRVAEYKITPDTSIDLKGVAGTLKVLEKVEEVKTLYSIYDYSKSEFESRGITGSSLINAWVAAPQSVVFAFENPDAGIKALTEGFTSASAVSIRFASFGLVEVHGPDVERFVNKLAK